MRTTSTHFQALLAFASLTLVGLAGCATEEDASGSDAGCEGAKCDTPNDPPEESCSKRQAEVINSSNRGYTPEGIRWACADVEGVNANGRDDRGQEYCEYYAIVELPNGEAVDLGRPTGNGVTSLSVCVEGDEGDDCRATITEDELFDLEDAPDEVVGACMFNSWHRDVQEPYANCQSEDDCQAKVFGFPLTAENARMKIGFNSNGAAADLVQRCFELEGLAPEPDFENPDDPNNEPFFRGCMGTNALFGTEWRRSDPSICAAVNRLNECGCTAPGVETAADLGRAVVPPGSDKFRGFALGTWDDQKGLPPGCRYADTGEDSNTAVVCDLTATDLLSNLNDPKEACRSIYGGNVVVHVDLPTEVISCEEKDVFGNACGNQPWNIGDENAGGDTDPPPSGDCGLRIAEVFYDSVGSDNGKEWIKLYNSCEEEVSVNGLQLRWGGGSYSGDQDLEGSVPAKGCFIVGGTKSEDNNGNPEIDMPVNLSPDLQNSGADADGIALFGDDDNPIDAVIYGEENTSGLIDHNGEVVAPHVGDAPEGTSIVLVGEREWAISEAPTPDDCPKF
ncbi:MAG: hypothetical protein AAF721_37845 [Myxococcota bacterium]